MHMEEYFLELFKLAKKLELWDLIIQKDQK